ncbi:urea ABC transporter permease subunit UrtC, partial [Vibrio breoganii]
VWLFALGGLFVLSTMYFPQGVIGFVSEKWQLLRKASGSRGKGQGKSDKDDQSENKEVIA